MKILYVAPLFVGFEDILRGEKDAKGLPSFIFPLKSLFDGGSQVDIILVSSYRDKINITVDWISNANILDNINYDLTRNTFVSKVANKIRSSVRLARTTYKALSNNQYDLVYCHDKPAVIANIVANIMGVPCGYRLYGTFNLIEKTEKYGKISMWFKEPIYSLIFNLSKKFLLITDDGTKGDVVHKALAPKNKKYDFYFWKNGVDFYYVDSLDETFEIPKEPYIFLAGRIAPFKRQDRAILTLKKVHESGSRIHLYFAGHISNDNQQYYEHLLQITNAFGLEDYVHFLGAVPREFMRAFSYHAIAVIAMEDLSNRGNVFYEQFSTGSVFVAINDGSLNEYLQHGVNGFIIENEEEAAQVVANLYNNADVRKRISLSAITTARDIFSTWENRIIREIEVIEAISV